MEATLLESNVIIQKMETSAKSGGINNVAIKKAAMITRAVNHKLRQEIIKLLEENKRMHVTEIYEKLKLEQSTTSQHLALLRRANIVNTVRNGRLIYYSLNHPRISEFSDCVTKLVLDPTAG